MVAVVVARRHRLAGVLGGLGRRLVRWPGWLIRAVFWAFVAVGLVAGAVGSTPRSVEATPVASLFGCPGYPEFTAVAGVLAMGDSYSAGEGLDCFDPATDISKQNECHRSDYAYSAYVDETANHNFVACAGIVTAQILTDQNWDEPPQLEHVNSNYDTILLTIGGNDVKFSAVLKSCVAAQDLYVPGPACDDQISETSDLIRDSMRGKLLGTYNRILDRMSPTARLVVGLYPTIFPAPGWTGESFLGLDDRLCVAGTLQGFSSTDIGFLDDDVEKMRHLQLDMNQAIRDAVAAASSAGDVRIRVAETEFPNNAISCGDDGRPTPFINGLRFAPGAGIANLPDLPKFVSGASFHPNQQGQISMGVIIDHVAEPEVPLAILAPGYGYVDSDKPAELSRRVGQSMYLEFATIGGTGVVTWDEPAGLPPGVTFDPANGRIQGRSIAVGDYPVAFTAHSGGHVATRTVTLRVTSITPCTLVWDSPSGGSWFLASNWAPQRVPTASDIACIGGGGLYPSVEAGEIATVGTVLTEYYGGIRNDGVLRIVGTTMDSKIESDAAPPARSTSVRAPI